MAEGKRGLWWWIDRWRRSGSWMDMTLAQQGAYRNLLDEQRLRGGQIPNDERILAKACGDPLEWADVRDKVLAKFDVSADGLWLSNKTATEVNAASDELSEARASAGQKGFEAVERGSRGRFTGKPRANGRANPRADRPAKPRASVSVSVSVSDSVSGTENGNGVAPAGAVAPLALAKPVATSPPWSHEFTDDWRAAYGGEPTGECFAQVRRGAKQWTWERVRPVLKFYMAESPAEYVNLPKFFSALPSWEKRMGGAPARGSPRSVGERQLAAAAEFIRGGKGGSG